MTDPAPVPPPSRLRWAWWLLAWLSLGLGLLGVVLPGLPTVPFILLSAYAAARGSSYPFRVASTLNVSRFSGSNPGSTRCSW